MLANFLNKSKPINFIGLTVFFFLGYLSYLFRLFSSKEFSFNTLLESILLLALFIVIFFIFNFIMVKNRLTFDNSYAFFFFILLTFCMLPVIANYKVLILFVIYLLFVRKIYSLRSINKVLEKLFDAGLWLGILFILDSRTLIFVPLIYAAIYIHHKITIHTTLVPVVGFATPLFIYFTYNFWYDKTEEFTNLFEPNFSLNFDFYTNSKYLLLITILLILSFVSLIFKSLKTLTINNTFRRNWVLLIIHTLIAIIYLFFVADKNGSETIYILFTIAIILANGIEMITKKLFKNIALYLMIFCATGFYIML
ncbi:DUF6427 family protein [Polaribacter sp. MED152]|uniref:DUF6427 family protein n=1 Tax=Polaribacter sp. MED152 TaxID=313598 RepID=UPI000068C789|nr:DUF6427 family protein [Polaribacter sp. MED152]EAQ42913.1 hypothetical protein MED152_09325 [Polaribacter sp. MED152]